MTKTVNTRLNQVSLHQARDMIELLVDDLIEHGGSGKHLNIMIRGRAGSGKSAIWKQITEKYNVALIDKRIGNWDETALLGVPFVPFSNNNDEATCEVSTPRWFTEVTDAASNNDFVVLLLDEFLNAPPQTQHAAYQIVLDRTITNGRKLPDNVLIVAMGNLKSEKTGARDPLPAAANRFGQHYEIAPRNSDYISHFTMNGWDKRIVGFLEYSPQSLFGDFGIEDATATPRTWEDVKNVLRIIDKAKDKGKTQEQCEELLDRMVSSAIGTTIGSEFAAYCRHVDLTPDYKAIGDKGHKALGYTIPKDRGLVFATVYNAGGYVANKIKDAIAIKETDKTAYAAMVDHVENVMQFMMIFETEYQIIAWRAMRRSMENSELKYILDEPKWYAVWQVVSKMLRGL